MVYDGFCILHAGLEVVTVATYLVDLASYLIYSVYIGMLKILGEYWVVNYNIVVIRKALSKFTKMFNQSYGVHTMAHHATS